MFLLPAASADELWIGFNDIRTEGLFDWSDHSSVGFTSWTFGKPAVSTDAEDCVLITGEVREVMLDMWFNCYIMCVESRLK